MQQKRKNEGGVSWFFVALGILVLGSAVFSPIFMSHRENRKLAELNPTKDLTRVAICIDTRWRPNSVAKELATRPNIAWCPPGITKKGS